MLSSIPVASAGGSELTARSPQATTPEVEIGSIEEQSRDSMIGRKPTTVCALVHGDNLIVIFFDWNRLRGPISRRVSASDHRASNRHYSQRFVEALFVDIPLLILPD